VQALCSLGRAAANVQFGEVAQMVLGRLVRAARPPRPSGGAPPPDRSSTRILLLLPPALATTLWWASAHYGVSCRSASHAAVPALIVPAAVACGAYLVQSTDARWLAADRQERG